MKVVVQRVKKCKVNILDDNSMVSIQKGILVLLAIANTDNMDKAKWMANKIVNLRIFADAYGKMNLSVKDIKGEIIIVSNFTLYGDVQRGFRPSFTYSAPPNTAIPIYQEFIRTVRELSELNVETGKFGSMMEIELINDGPVTIIIEK
ncbi:MAG: D-aminoacyl-tRNA deacylase [Candidatus Kapaibacteriales bacterium]